MISVPKGRHQPFRLLYKNLLRYSVRAKSGDKSDVPIDILIPVIKKDLSKLSFVIDSARKNILNRVDNIYVVGPAEKLIQDFCTAHDCFFINENDILPIQKSDILYKNVQWSRAGWLLQQLIKLSADEITKNENVLVLDADTCFTSKQSFVLNNGNFILNFSDEYHFPYNIYKKILSNSNRFFLSFVCHHMIFNKTILRNLKNDIQSNTGKNWINAILCNIDFDQPSCFSEYEMYGNYLYYNYSEKIHLEYWKNVTIKNEPLTWKLLGKFDKKFKTVSFHEYFNR